MAPKNKRPKKLETKDFILKSAISVLQQEGTQRAMLDRAVKGNKKRARVEEVMKAIQSGSTFKAPGTQASRYAAMRPVAVKRVPEQAARSLGPSSSITPLDIELAMRRQGIDWLQPFAPGSPLTPYYGYNRMPRMRAGRNTTPPATAGCRPSPGPRHQQTTDLAGGASKTQTSPAVPAEAGQGPRRQRKPVKPASA